ncbi:MAG: hypothetical protein FJZ60_04625 [Chlamydiae bacterium]|nr:hypothetical protein [Chlamydiota bacterium]
MKLEELKTQVKGLEESLKLAREELKKAENDFSMRIDKCPGCGVEINGPNFCKTITCAMAPKITC